MLEKIITNKLGELSMLKQQQPLATLLNTKGFKEKSVSAKKAICRADSSGIIAEFKRKSPSKGMLNISANVASIIASYEKHQAAMCSVLTDSKFFGARESDFSLARKNCSLPLLRKDFMLDEYQVYQTKAMQADVILLIAAILTPEKCKKLAKIAKSIGLEVLLEIHSEDELAYLSPEIDLVGINNRNLKSFRVDLKRSKNLAEKIPLPFIKIAESGIQDFRDIIRLKLLGFRGFLIGEHFMKSANPGLACKALIDKIKDEN